MPSLSPEQLIAVQAAQQLLVDAGLTVTDFPASAASTISPRQEITSVIPTSSILLSGLFRLNRKSYIHGIIDHSLASVIEYPQSGAVTNEGVAHRFAVHPNGDLHPKDNIQYSLGDTRGQRKNVNCLVFSTAFGQPILSHLAKLSCKCGLLAFSIF